MIKIFTKILFNIAGITLGFIPVFGQSSRFSGYPVPRFVSVKYDNTNTRFGPNAEYPIKYTYTKRFEPLRVINEYYNWYQVQDMTGAISWIYVSNLSSGKYAKLTKYSHIYDVDDTDAEIIAHINTGTLVKIKNCNKEFCKIETRFNDKIYKGYIYKPHLWGV